MRQPVNGRAYTVAPTHGMFLTDPSTLDMGDIRGKPVQAQRKKYGGAKFVLNYEVAAVWAARRSKMPRNGDAIARAS